MGATGEAREKGLYDAARDFSFADLKGDLDSIGELCGAFHWEDGGAEWLHAAKRGSIKLNSDISSNAKNNSSLGVAGQLARRVAEKLKFRQDVFVAELQLDPVYAAMQAAKEARRYEPLPRFPSVERDFSLLLADGTKFSDVTKSIQSLGIGEIHSIEATDLFRGKNVPAGKYSLLVRVTFQSRDATLTDTQIADFSGKIVAALEKTLGAQLRAS
jgi:phenylalanyl-tRNA synthetase beta chain